MWTRWNKEYNEMTKKQLMAGWLVLALIAGGLAFAGSSNIGDTDLVASKVKKIVNILDTILSTTSTINGETIADDTIDDDSIDFSDVTGADLTLTDVGDFASTGSFEPDIVIVSDTNAYTVLDADSGQVHLVPDLTADSTITLPTPVDSLRYRFVYAGGAADAQDWIIDSGDDDHYFIGGVATIDPGQTNVGSSVSANIYSDGNSNSKLTVYTPEAGTAIELYCVVGAATNWYVSGLIVSDTDTGAAFADQ